MDAIFAITIANEILTDAFLPTLRFGRKSKLRSHSIYFVDQSLASEEIRDPMTDKMVIEFRCLNKDGSRGHQTVFPPSRNYDPETGIQEQIEVDPNSAAEIATVSGKKLVKAVRCIGAIALLAKYFPVSGNRHTTILALAGLLARAGKPVEYALNLIVKAYQHSDGFNHDVPKVQNDIRGVYRTLDVSPDTNLSGYPTLIEIMPEKVICKVRELLGIEPHEITYPLTDSGNGDWLVSTFGDQIRFCHDARAWFSYDHSRGLWIEGDMAVRELAKKRGQSLRHQAQSLTKPAPTRNIDGRDADKRLADQQKAILVAANRAENAEGIRGMLFAASSDSRIICSRNDFDQHDNLLNVANGVLNLYTGELLAHDPKYLFTKRCPTEYDANAKHDIWDETLAAITRNHPDVAPFLQVLAGYSTQGNKTEERMFSLHGPAETGKGTFERAITSTLGEDCVRTVAPETVLKQARSSGAASSDISRLEGARWVIVSELEKGNRLQESLLKAMSGNDTVVARGLFKEERQFRPTWQFWFQTNHRLGFDSTDSGNKRRFIEIPFDNVLAKDPLVKFDRNLKSWMRTDKEFHNAVLAWIVEGCIRWRKEGLQIPDSVRKATDALFASNDFLRDFITERCVVEKNAKVFISVMKAEYISYCIDEGEEPARGRTFNHMLEERGYVRKQATIEGKGGKAWHGIRLKTFQEMQAQTIPKKPMGTATLDTCFAEEEVA